MLSNCVELENRWINYITGICFPSLNSKVWFPFFSLYWDLRILPSFSASSYKFSFFWQLAPLLSNLIVYTFSFALENRFLSPSSCGLGLLTFILLTSLLWDQKYWNPSCVNPKCCPLPVLSSFSKTLTWRCCKAWPVVCIPIMWGLLHFSFQYSESIFH